MSGSMFSFSSAWVKRGTVADDPRALQCFTAADLTGLALASQKTVKVRAVAIWDRRAMVKVGDEECAGMWSQPTGAIAIGV